MTRRQKLLYWLMGLLRIARSPNQVGRILELIPDDGARWRWCTATCGCGCMGCVNRSEWPRVSAYRLTEAEHRWWRTVRNMQREAAELPVIRRQLLTLMGRRPMKADVLRLFPPCT